MRDFLAYYWLLITTAVRHSLDFAQTILFCALIAVGLLAKFVPTLRTALPDISGWIVAAIVLGTVVLVRLLLAPYWIHQTEAEKLRAATDTESLSATLHHTLIATQEAHTNELRRQREENSPLAVAERERALESARIAIKLDNTRWLSTMYSLAAAHFALPQRQGFRGDLPSPQMLETLLSDIMQPGQVPSIAWRYRDNEGRDFHSASVDFAGYRFSWNWRCAANGIPRQHGFSVHPWEIEQTDLWKEYVSEQIWRHLSSRAEFTWEVMRDGIAKLIAKNRLRVWARKQSPTASPEIIPSDSWLNFVVSDWARGAAVSDDERLYSVHLEVVDSEST